MDLGAHSWALHRCARPRNWVTGRFTLKYIWRQSSLTSGCPICKGHPGPGRGGLCRALPPAPQTGDAAAPGRPKGHPTGRWPPPAPRPLCFQHEPRKKGLRQARPWHPWDPRDDHLQGLLGTQNEQVGAEALGGVELRLAPVGGLDQLIGPPQGGGVCQDEAGRRDPEGPGVRLAAPWPCPLPPLRGPRPTEQRAARSGPAARKERFGAWKPRP